MRSHDFAIIPSDSAGNVASRAECGRGDPRHIVHSMPRFRNKIGRETEFIEQDKFTSTRFVSLSDCIV